MVFSKKRVAETKQDFYHESMKERRVEKHGFHFIPQKD
jgi:hypothetical protein